MSDDESKIVMMMQIHCICKTDIVSMNVVDILIAYYYLLLLAITTYGCYQDVYQKKHQNFQVTVV